MMLPYPPSTNRLTRIGNGRVHASPQARAWKQSAAWLAKQAGMVMLDGEVHVAIRLHPRATKAGAASKTRVDIDNAIKAALDALNGIAWHDDKQVVRLVAEVANAIKNGGLAVEVTAA